MSSLTITIIQSELHWENRAANLAMFEQKIMSIRERTEVVVLPEMFTTGFSMNPAPIAESMDGDTVKWMKKIAAAKKIILTGSVIITEDGKYFNRLLWVLPDGSLGYYDKRHRFAFAGEDQEYTSGNKRLIARVKGWRLNLLICYDLRFPVWARQTPGEEPEFDLILYVANWPERRVKAWKTLLTARAIENQCFVVGVNRTGDDANGIHYSGDSMVIDPLGEVLYNKAGEEDIHTITIEKETVDAVRSKFPFWKDADDFNIIN